MAVVKMKTGSYANNRFGYCPSWVFHTKCSGNLISFRLQPYSAVLLTKASLNQQKPIEFLFNRVG